MAVVEAVRKAGKGDTYYGKRATNYETRRRKQPWWKVEQQEMRALLETLPRGLSVLDVPFGTGRFVEYYRDRGFSIHGLDASQDMLAAAEAALGAEIYADCTCVTGDAAALPYDDGQFDLVVSTRFLRDIVPFGDAKRILAEMSRVTRRYAIIQLGENPAGHRRPSDDEVMGSEMSRAELGKLLRVFGLAAVDRRLVKSGEDTGDIHHVLCEKL